MGGGQHKFKSFADTCAGAKHYFDDGINILTSVWSDYSSIRTEDFNIKYYLKSNNKVHKYSCTDVPDCGLPNFGYAWVSEDQIPRNKDDYKRHKILVGQAFTARSNQVMDIPQYVGDNSCCSQSYIPIFSPNNTEEECLNICKYIKTRFFRYLVSVLKIGQNLGNRVYKLVPTQDFTSNSDIDWSESVYDIERQLYVKYNLNEEEIEYIDNTIKQLGHRIKINIGGITINIKDYEGITYDKAELMDLQKEALSGINVDTANIGNKEFTSYYIYNLKELKGMSLAIYYHACSRIRCITMDRSEFVRLDIDDDTVIDKLLVEDYLQDTRRLLFKKDMYISLTENSIKLDFLK